MRPAPTLTTRQPSNDQGSFTQPSPRRSKRASQLEPRPSPPVGERVRVLTLSRRAASAPSPRGARRAALRARWRSSRVWYGPSWPATGSGGPRARPPHRRGGGERDEQREGEHAHRDEGPLEDILSHALPGKEVVETYPDGEVHTDVEEGQEAEESPELDRPGPAEQDAQRGHAEAR